MKKIFKHLILILAILLLLDTFYTWLGIVKGFDEGNIFIRFFMEKIGVLSTLQISAISQCFLLLWLNEIFEKYEKLQKFMTIALLIPIAAKSYAVILWMLLLKI